MHPAIWMLEGAAVLLVAIITLITVPISNNIPVVIYVSSTRANTTEFAFVVNIMS